MINKYRLIDAGRLGRKIAELYVQPGIQYWEVASLVEHAPTIEAEPVVHGRWIEWYPPMHMIMTGEELLYRCSACDAKYPDVEGYRYCPRCGAMMDESNL